MRVTQRWPQLDGLRAIAVLMVVWSHTVRDGLGGYGVKTFFVLSGFLITGILLRQREQPLGVALRRFYLRRALRIFPVYYFLLLVLALADVPGVRRDIGWHLLYLSNWLMAARGTWATAVGHLWSLSVEEQFYLVWPLLVLATPARHLLRVLWTVVAVGVGSRIVLPLLTANVATLSTPTVVSLDALAIGALLAWYGTGPWARRVAWIGVGLIGLCQLLGVVGRGFKVVQLLDPIGIALVAAWAVDGCVRGFGGWWGRLLSARAMRWIGTVSYGVYLFHFPVVWALQSAGWAHGFPLFAGTLMATLSLAALSWRYLERPLNDLKNRAGVGVGRLEPGWAPRAAIAHEPRRGR
jgi:peptidoglycan/LPS O-acetylase OafA/YrhL